MLDSRREGSASPASLWRRKSLIGHNSVSGWEKVRNWKLVGPSNKQYFPISWCQLETWQMHSFPHKSASQFHAAHLCKPHAPTWILLSISTVKGSSVGLAPCPMPLRICQGDLERVPPNLSSGRQIQVAPESRIPPTNPLLDEFENCSTWSLPTHTAIRNHRGDVSTRWWIYMKNI